MPVPSAAAPEILTGDGPLIAPLPFTAEEYAGRLLRVRAAMAAADLDLFVAFGPETINWLTGHDTPAYHYLQASIVSHDAPPVNVLRGIEVTNTLMRTWSRRAVAYADHDEPADAVVAAVLAVARRGARIGVEDDGFFPGARRHRLIEAGLRAAGFEVVPAHPVDALRLVKSAEEMAHIRAAARITEHAMAAAIEAAGEGVDENAVAARAWAALVERGGQFPGLPPFIVSGPRTSLGHATWDGRLLRAGDPLAFEIPGVVHRYVAPLFRCGTVGRPSADMRALEAAALAALDALTGAIRPGLRADALHGLSVEAFAARGLALGHRSGYSVGVNYAPDWGEGHLFSLTERETRPLLEGMVLHLVPGIYVPGRHCVVISETVAVTAAGCECVTRFPRALFAV